MQVFFKNDFLDYEPNQRKVFIFLARFSKIVFDVGTQIGIYAILAAKAGSSKIYAFDIEQSFLKIAKKHAINNNFLDKIEFIEAAIGENEDGYIYIDNFCGKSKLKSISLDFFCKQNKVYPNLIKMDIEGYELEALRGAKEILSKKPILILSLHPQFILARNKNPKEVLEILFRRNFFIVDLTDRIGEIVNVNSFDYYLNFYRITDFLAIYNKDPNLNEIISFIKK
ncbi:MAG: FkbM family methyltransferase [Patescibacteria group bacterium]|nr:FkbM family methyltransferase [Patescibacteria group bacterium]